jgi:hypothetical protein
MNRLRDYGKRFLVLVRAGWAAVTLGIVEIFTSARGRRVLALAALGATVFLFVKHPPMTAVEPGTLGVRINRLTGSMAVLPEGPGRHPAWPTRPASLLRP